TLITIAPSPADRTQREHREHKARRHNIDQVNALKTPFDTSHLVPSWRSTGSNSQYLWMKIF
ncbi:hypothetical protein, partial [Lentzea tibetensis]|uniref:hypothetical protein n=1 Tax=Lentzea tibetensis TaxID=2591470 RepID=UPI001C997B72